MTHVTGDEQAGHRHCRFCCFAVAEIGPRFSRRITVNMVPIPNALTRPGSTGASQSNMSKGTNGTPATLDPKKKIPISAAVSMAATNKRRPIPGCRIFISSVSYPSDLGYAAIDVMLYAKNLSYATNSAIGHFYDCFR
jgi:hypothetical protein